MAGLHWAHVWNRRGRIQWHTCILKRSHTEWCVHQCEWVWVRVSSTNRCDSDLMMITLGKRPGRFVSSVLSWRWHLMCNEEIVGGELTWTSLSERLLWWDFDTVPQLWWMVNYKHHHMNSFSRLRLLFSCCLSVQLIKIHWFGSTSQKKKINRK